MKGRRLLAFPAPLLAVLVLLSWAGSASAQAPGSLDGAFGSGGVASVSGAQLFGVGVQADGEVVAAGQSQGSVLLQRFTASGQPEGRSLGGGGTARAVAIARGGEIVVAGNSGGMFAERFSAGGAPDATFGSSGVAIATPLGSAATADAVAVQPDGKIVVAGCVNASACTPVANTQIAVARFNANGTLDPSFGSGGAVVIHLGLPYAAAMGVAIQPDGKIVLVGYEQGSTTFAFFNGLVIRLTSSGALDPSFNGSGVFSYHQPGGGYTSLNAIALQNDGKIVAAGADAGGPNALLLRLSSTGALDSGFGSAGVTAISAGIATSHPFGAYGVGIAGGGAVVASGAYNDNGQSDAALWAATAGGAPPPGFGSGGTVRAPAGGFEGCALAIAPDGSLVTAGNSVSVTTQADPCTVTGSSSAFVARFIGYGPPPVPPTGTAPSVSTGGANGISATEASVTGQVNPDGLPTSYGFEYGTTAAYGSSTPAASLSAGASAETVSATLRNLSPGTTYHYRLVASNSAGTTRGLDGTFTTKPRLVFELHGLRSSYKIASVIAGGLAVKVSCTQPCSFEASLVISSTVAKRLGLGSGKGTVTIGGASGSLQTTRSRKVVIRLSKAAKRALKRRLRVTVTLHVVFARLGGGPPVRWSRSLAFKS